MLCFSGFELYSRWVPMLCVETMYEFVSTVITFRNDVDTVKCLPLV